MALLQSSLLSRPLSRPLSSLTDSAIWSRPFTRALWQIRNIENVRSGIHQRRCQSSRTLCSAPDGVTGQVCNWVDSIRLQDIPLEIQAKVKYLVLDGLACMIIGAKLPWSRTATQAILDIEGRGNCTLFGWNKNLSPLNAALLNGTFVQGFELDDVHVDAPWHANSVILPALFAAAEYSRKDSAQRSKTDGSSFLLSTIVGFELGSRVGRALHGSEMLSRGWHSGAVFGPPAAAAAVSKLLGLDPGQTEDALGTACTQASGLMSAQYESMGKRMQHGFAARNGLFAALMSRKGYTGIDQVFERPYGGYLTTIGQGSKYEPPFLENELVDGLGNDWRGIDGIRVKPYNSMIATHAPIDCTTALQAKYPSRFADLDSIRRINIEQSKAPHAHGGQVISRPITTTGAQMSTRYIAAAQLLDREVLLHQFSASNLNRDAIWDLASKMECAWNPEFDKKGKWYTRASVLFADGETVEEEVATSETMARLLPGEKIREKYRMLTDGIIDAGVRDRLEYAILNLEALDDVHEISRLLGGEVRSALSS